MTTSTTASSTGLHPLDRNCAAASGEVGDIAVSTGSLLVNIAAEALFDPLTHYKALLMYAFLIAPSLPNVFTFHSSWPRRRRFPMGRASTCTSCSP
mmetsp:Transcript_68854/g.212947  ORF Transcript_68854/g.212947 Transcript_68854/m.212947 type:complete len:96 (-) Transcript_68854:1178-1465(-)